MKGKNKLLLFVASTCLLSSISIMNVNVAANDDEKVSNVSEAIDKLINAHNYTLQISTKAGPIDINYEVYYTENGFYDNYLGDEYGFVAVNDGVFSFDLYNRKMTSSKLLFNDDGEKITSIWDSKANLFNGFHKMSINDFKEATGKTFASNSKRTKNVFLNLFKIDFGKYQYVEPVSFTVDDNINTLQFTFSMTTGEQYFGKVIDYNKTKIDLIDNYLSENNSYHQSAQELQQIIDLFDNYNYTRLIYADDVDDYSVIAGKEIYDKDYFYTFFDPKYMLAGYGYEIGMVGIDKTYGPYEANGKTYGPYTFNGSYYCSIKEDENGEQKLQIMTSMPISKDPFVPNVYNYPTFLKCFSSPQYFDETGNNTTQYYTSKVDCVTDFVNNFQLGANLQETGAVPIGLYVQYLPNGDEKYAQTLGKETVVFELEVSYYGAITTIPFVYVDFNTTKIDCISQDLIDQYINGVIESIIKEDANNTESGE